MSTEATTVGDKKDGKKQVLPSCTVGELFQFADSWDYVLYVSSRLLGSSVLGLSVRAAGNSRLATPLAATFLELSPPL